jgi:hypothetical protein
MTLEGNAVISGCGRYRYLLTRLVGPGSITATFIMLNPSTADATIDDPTIRRCIGFARRWDCGRLAVLNLFALRTTYPADLNRTDDPVGPRNEECFDRTLKAAGAGPVVCAWGVHGAYLGQDQTVLGWIRPRGIQLLSLGLTRSGHPKHPLYLPRSAELVRFERGLFGSGTGRE